MIQHHNPAPAPPHRAVILGATGFVGGDVARHLRERAVAVLPLGSAEVDLTTEGAAGTLTAVLRPEDALVFVSALTPDRGRDVGTLMTNLRMAEQVCRALDSAPCNHVLYVSSDAVYGDEHEPIDETSCASAPSFHGLMHLARERMLAHTLTRDETPLMVVRPTAVFGAGDTHNSYGPNRFVRTAVAERRITLFGEGEETRDHLYVGDLSNLIGEALFYRSSGVVNAASGRSCSFREVAELVAGLGPEPVEVVGTPRANPITHRRFDVTALRRAFPRLAPTDLATALGGTHRALAGAR